MHLTGLKIRAVNVPLLKPYTISLVGEITTTRSIIVELFTDQGLVGIGETDPELMFTGESQQTVMTMRAIGLPTEREVWQTDAKYLRNLAYRANELTGTSDVGEWVDDLQGQDVWYKLRNEPNVFNAMRGKGMRVGEIPQGFKGLDIPLEGIDFTFYKTGESSDWDATSGNITPNGLTPSKTDGSNLNVPVGKISAYAPMPEELVEDSIINMLEEARRKLQIQVDENTERYLLMGDTETGASANINFGTTTPSTKSDYLIFNGLMRNAIIDNTPVDANNTINEALFISIYDQMPDTHMEEDRLMFIYDTRTKLQAIQMPLVVSRNVNSTATIENGVMTSIWGIDTMSSARIPQALATGLYDDTTPANNTQGRIILVRPDQTIFVGKRRPVIEVFRDPKADAEEIVMHMRLGFKVRDADAVKGAIDVKTSKSP